MPIRSSLASELCVRFYCRGAIDSHTQPQHTAGRSSSISINRWSEDAPDLLLLHYMHTSLLHNLYIQRTFQFALSHYAPRHRCHAPHSLRRLSAQWSKRFLACTSADHFHANSSEFEATHFRKLIRLLQAVTQLITGDQQHFSFACCCRRCVLSGSSMFVSAPSVSHFSHLCFSITTLASSAYIWILAACLVSPIFLAIQRMQKRKIILFCLVFFFFELAEGIVFFHLE